MREERREEGRRGRGGKERGDYRDKESLKNSFYRKIGEGYSAHNHAVYPLESEDYFPHVKTL